MAFWVGSWVFLTLRVRNDIKCVSLRAERSVLPVGVGGMWFETSLLCGEGDCFPGQDPGQASPIGLLAMTSRGVIPRSSATRDTPYEAWEERCKVAGMLRVLPMKHHGYSSACGLGMT
jgi:hypothetical protein